MNMQVTPAKLRGVIPAISSKSDAHRVLIAAALADQETVIACNVRSEDIRATARCLCALGAQIVFGDDVIIVQPIAKAPRDAVTLDCGESGSTLRFLLPVVSALGTNGVFTGQGRLPERPVADLRAAMERHGVVFSPEQTFPITTSGMLSCGEYVLKGNVSSQYVTGLLFALPLLPGDSIIRLLPPVESAPYVQMTLHTLARFGICIEQKENTFFIAGNQKYHTPGQVSVEGDWSNAAFFLTAGALGEPVTVTGLNTTSAQGDKAILTVLESMGAQVDIQADAVTVSPGTLRGVTVNAADIPDLVPVLSVAAAAAASGVTVIENAARLRIKESDRLASMQKTLTKLGAVCAETDDGLLVWSGEGIQGGHVFGFQDHRVVMAAAIAAVVAREPIVIRGAEAVQKSYPLFFEDYNKLGGKADVLNSDG